MRLADGGLGVFAHRLAIAVDEAVQRIGMRALQGCQPILLGGFNLLGYSRVAAKEGWLRIPRA